MMTVKEDTKKISLESNLNYTRSVFENVPSLIKWTGSKRLQASEIQKYIPEEFNRYFEPFLGGGSILYNNTDHESFGNDIYEPLIDIWNLVKVNPQKVILKYQEDWEKLQDNFPEYFYTVRNRFNESHQGQDLLFLSRTAVNGIIRFNSKGEFNNSLHLSRKGMMPDSFAKIVMKWHEKLINTTFYSEDFTVFLKKAQQADFVYLDPPYANSKNRYIKNLDLDALFSTLDELNKKEVKWALSFDGIRGKEDLKYPVPEHLFKSVVFINNGSSKIGQVLNKKQEIVHEALYMNY